MKLLIIGATRGIGFELLRQAVAAGHEITVLARYPEKSPARMWRISSSPKLPTRYFSNKRRC
ncbi:hypothetical protein D3OALGA1CA_877 [Olavius algarvensis associated proteobacterium Delta 3]|nr:hypothetical protein D3OALGA1CA_877 [Olavius algarvensis associated proteobacterium Delta 3]CAB5143558.1 hypothetical protein D3OALGB2SA_4380 [Olavius algarvensis associated proteobacterium Delta 3]